MGEQKKVTNYSEQNKGKAPKRLLWADLRIRLLFEFLADHFSVHVSLLAILVVVAGFGMASIIFIFLALNNISFQSFMMPVSLVNIFA